MELIAYIAIFVITYLTWICSKPLRDFYSFLRISRTSAKALKQFPCEPYHWLFGHLTSGGWPGPVHEGLKKFAEWTQKYPRYFVLHIGPVRSVLVLNHPETVKHMLKTSEPKNVIGGGGYKFLKPWIGDGLLLSSGPKWFRNRRLLTPGFHFDVLKPYMEVYNTCTEILLEVLSKAASTETTIDVYKPIQSCALDIILRCAFSTKRNVQRTGHTQDPYAKNVRSLARTIINRFPKPLHYIDSIYYRSSAGQKFKQDCDFSHQFANDVIVQRQKELADNSKDPRLERKYIDFLDILLLARDENGDGLTEQEIQDEVETFMFEGHDTTASGIAWLLHNLATHPEIQETARKEVDAILEGRENEAILWEDMNKLPYLTMCIRESLRMYPPVYQVGRQTTKSTEIDGKVVPPGTIIGILIYNVHHNGTVWENPEKYDPDRFLPEKSKKMDPYAFIPFSAGPRNCIGQHFALNEIKTVVATILRKFKFTRDSETEARMLPDLVLRPETKIPLRFEARFL